MLYLLRYLSSFIDGRVRLRHPALRKAAIVADIHPHLQAWPGMRTVTFNTQTGSVLLEYDPGVLPKERLIELAEPWARYLEARQKGLDVPMPSV